MMDVINTRNECEKAELDLFSLPSTQTNIEDGQWDVVKPQSNFNTGTVTFDIGSTGQHYIDLANTELHVKAQIYGKDDKPITKLSETNINVVNNVLGSMFSQVEVQLNNTPAENTNSTYAYRSYFENVLNYSKGAKDTFLQYQGFFPESDSSEMEAGHKTMTGGTVEQTAQFKKVNSAAKKRNDLFSLSKSYYKFVGNLHLDTFNLNRYMLNKVDVRVIMTRSKPEFLFHGLKYDNETLRFEDCFLKIRRCKISDSISLRHNQILEGGKNAMYPFKRVIVRAIHVPANTDAITLNSIHSGIIPSRVLMGLVTNNAYNGHINLNPFNFQHFKLKESSLKLSSRNICYSSPLKFDYTTNDCNEGYNSLYKNIKSGENGITIGNYMNGHALYAYDLSPDLCSEDHYSVLSDGTLSMDLTFDGAPAETLMAMFYLEFDNILEVTKSRSILFDYKI